MGKQSNADAGKMNQNPPKKEKVVETKTKVQVKERDQEQKQGSGLVAYIPMCCAVLFLITAIIVSTGSPNGRGSQMFGRTTQNQSARITVSLEDIYFGHTVEFEKSRVIVCDSCAGEGIRPDADIKTCKECHGEGFIRRIQNMGHITYQQKMECPTCRGQGIHVHPEDKCPVCKGKGQLRDKTKIALEIPKGHREGANVVKEGLADELPGANTGDLIILISSKKHSFFTRKEDIHLEFTAEISLLESLVGFKRRVKHISGELITIRRDEVTSHGEVIEFPGRGMPLPDDPTQFGTLYMNVKVEFPKQLSANEKEVVQSLLGGTENDKILKTE